MIPKSAIDIAREVLIHTRAKFPLGSDNIKTVRYNPATDNYIVNPNLLGLAERSRAVNALLDPDLTPSVIHENTGDEVDIMTEAIESLMSRKLLTQDMACRLHRSYLSHETTLRCVGRCDAMASCAFVELEREIVDGTTKAFTQNEMFCFAEPKHIRYMHVFVVLNRPASSNVALWQSWGPDTIILDPWINRVFIAPNFYHEWVHINPFEHASNPHDWRNPFEHDSNNPHDWRMALMFDRADFWGWAR